MLEENFNCIGSILFDEFDLQDSKFIDFWYKNRLIKVKEKDKIKCWVQLGKVNTFKLIDNNSKPTYYVHIRDLLVALSRRAII